ncbi:hypothetical protein PG991_001411 [Apiospora marii]|uniref:Cytochrome c oxidase subunit n=1 Tax=Apiospora marii TaxID=335849 RepID=A0ABR1SS09_9PEZI
MSDDERETKPFKFVTGVDARFPNVNQTKHCWQNYVDYHKCINAKGEDFKPCRQFFLAYRSLCPSGWYQRWTSSASLVTSLLSWTFRSTSRSYGKQWLDKH